MARVFTKNRALHPRVAILMLTYNALPYVKESIRTIRKNTKDVSYELIVVDNKSKLRTRIWLLSAYFFGLIDKLYLNDENSYFSKGNNIAARLASSDVTHYLLLNSDVSIRSSDWLSRLLMVAPAKGVVSYGAVESTPSRADGYCLLIDKPSFDTHFLDEQYEWWWGITKLQAEVLRDGGDVLAIRNHEWAIHHYGGASSVGLDLSDRLGMNEDRKSVLKWFENGAVRYGVTLVDDIEDIENNAEHHA